MSTKVALDVNGVLRRLSTAVGAENDHQLALATGTAQTTISTWRSKGRIPYDLCVEVSKSKNVHIAWLLFGEDGVGTEKGGEDTGTIDVGFYMFCSEAAKKIVECDNKLPKLLVIALIYNSMWHRLEQDTFPGSNLNTRHAAMSMMLFGQMDALDWSAIAREVRSQFDQVKDPNKYISGEVSALNIYLFDYFTNRSPEADVRKRD